MPPGLLASGGVNGGTSSSQQAWPGQYTTILGRLGGVVRFVVGLVPRAGELTAKPSSDGGQRSFTAWDERVRNRLTPRWGALASPRSGRRRPCSGPTIGRSILSDRLSLRWGRSGPSIRVRVHSAWGRAPPNPFDVDDELRSDHSRTSVKLHALTGPKQTSLRGDRAARRDELKCHGR